MTASEYRSWRLTRGPQNYLISTCPSHLSTSFIQSAFASPDMYWARPLSSADLTLLLSSSLNLGLYIVRSRPVPSFPPRRTASQPSSPREGSPTVSLSGEETCDMDLDTEEEVEDTEEGVEELQQIGFARFITDHVTTFYLTDVYVVPEHRGTGLGRWLIQCCNEILEDKKALRRVMLMASPGEGVEFYEKELGMMQIDKEKHVLCMTRTGKASGDAGRSQQQR